MALSLLCALCALAAGDEYRIAAACGPYFPCDERAIEDRWQIERFAVPLERYPGNPLIVREHPWEGTGPHMGGSVLFDPKERLFKIWYSIWDREAYHGKQPFSYNVCYAESEDGLRWTKPALGLFDYRGSTANNCIRLGTDKTQNIDICLNPQPREYKGRFLSIHNQKGGVFVSSSDDGKLFSRLRPGQPVVAYHSDTHNNFVFDAIRRRWFFYGRPRAFAGDHKRRVAAAATKDLGKWPHETTILIPTETEAREFYGMTVFRRGDLFFGALQVYDRQTGRMTSELAWSGDGLRWLQLPCHEAWFAPGAEGAWDAGMVLVAESPVMVGDDMRFYYGGFARDHNATDNPCAIGLATARRDRLIGVRSLPGATGFVLTRPFDPSQQRLFVNARAQGTLRAELRFDNNKPVEGWTLDVCDTFEGDSFDHEVTWAGRSLRGVPVKEVRVLFELKEAELFAFDLKGDGA